MSTQVSLFPLNMFYPSRSQLFNDHCSWLASCCICLTWVWHRNLEKQNTMYDVCTLNHKWTWQIYKITNAIMMGSHWLIVYLDYKTYLPCRHEISNLAHTHSRNICRVFQRRPETSLHKFPVKLKNTHYTLLNYSKKTAAPRKPSTKNNKCTLKKSNTKSEVLKQTSPTLLQYKWNHKTGSMRHALVHIVKIISNY